MDSLRAMEVQYLFIIRFRILYIFLKSKNLWARNIWDGFRASLLFQRSIIDFNRHMRFSRLHDGQQSQSCDGCVAQTYVKFLSRNKTVYKRTDTLKREAFRLSEDGVLHNDIRYMHLLFSIVLHHVVIRQIH